MTSISHPSKELVREYLARRFHDPIAPPKLEDIRRQLGWELLPHDTRMDKR